jgi:putative flippase GtrA
MGRAFGTGHTTGTRLQPQKKKGFRKRLFSRRGAQLFARNTVVSVLAFALGILVLWVLVARYAWSEVLAAGVSFVAANTLHYALGRTWIYRGTGRPPVSGYAYFLLNALFGLAITLSLFALLVGWGVHYLIARVLVSIAAGIVLFLLNAFLNFRSL